ncbi:hypothetical protein Tco_0441763 [Tanacetum coccineum]
MDFLYLQLITLFGALSHAVCGFDTSPKKFRESEQDSDPEFKVREDECLLMQIALNRGIKARVVVETSLIEMRQRRSYPSPSHTAIEEFREAGTQDCWVDQQLLALTERLGMSWRGITAGLRGNREFESQELTASRRQVTYAERVETDCEDDFDFMTETLEPLNENGDELEGENGGNGNGGNRGNENGGNGGNGNGGNEREMESMYETMEGFPCQ